MVGDIKKTFISAEHVRNAPLVAESTAACLRLQGHLRLLKVRASEGGGFLKVGASPSLHVAAETKYH